MSVLHLWLFIKSMIFLNGVVMTLEFLILDRVPRKKDIQYHVQYHVERLCGYISIKTYMQSGLCTVY